MDCTSDLVPSIAPSNMQAALVNSTSVLVKWSAVSGGLLRGRLAGYLVQVKDPMGRLSNHSASPLEPRLLLSPLVPAHTYTVRVAAVTGAGVGPFTNEATLRLDQNHRLLDQTQHR